MLTSTPHIIAGHFYSIWHGSGDWERYEHPTAACPRVSKEWLEQLRRDDPLIPDKGPFR